MSNAIYHTRTYAKLTPSESLKLAREFNEMSQDDLAEASGIAQTAISAMEHGRIPIGADRAARLARALHVHPSVILFPDWTDSQPRAQELGERRRRIAK
jgi:transcriptional regulator with XRE-family HTH domain